MGSRNIAITFADNGKRLSYQTGTMQFIWLFSFVFLRYKMIPGIFSSYHVYQGQKEWRSAAFSRPLGTNLLIAIPYWNTCSLYIPYCGRP